MIAAMALHIRDFRQSDADALCTFSKAACRLGVQPAPASGVRRLAGVRDGRLTAALWFELEGKAGRIIAAAAQDTTFWRSDVLELIAEASLWLVSRGAARIELEGRPQDAQLLEGLREMQFKADEGAGTLHRLIRARSAA